MHHQSFYNDQDFETPGLQINLICVVKTVTWQVANDASMLPLYLVQHVPLFVRFV